MKFISRSTLGVAIGAVNILGFTLTSIYVIVVLSTFKVLTEEEKQNHQEVVSSSITLLYAVLIVCFVAIILSGLLIVGIIQRRHKLMKPWIFTAIVGIACHSARMIVGFFVGLATGMAAGTIISNLAYGFLTLVLQVVIFYPIFTLYKDLETRSNLNESEQSDLNVNEDDSPPSYSELEKGGQLR